MWQRAVQVAELIKLGGGAVQLDLNQHFIRFSPAEWSSEGPKKTARRAGKNVVLATSAIYPFRRSNSEKAEQVVRVSLSLPLSNAHIHSRLLTSQVISEFKGWFQINETQDELRTAREWDR
ncbi:hypothetical protein IW262DRAFT_1300520 [Armillaria fumosa]|nr:hypothetical protein IW262DRAFT_1300520 [Armillaria fumosa]